MMSAELRRKIEELLMIAKQEGVSILGLVDSADEAQCQIFRSIELNSRQGIRALDDIVMRQKCLADGSACDTCHQSCREDPSLEIPQVNSTLLYLVK
ncbi:hypothetical protein AWH66_2021670 [Vibrio barjaei]|jgi:hypothetical protein|nr:hypothetical protein AWH66_2021670 [Vibrio barjaei]